jgi:hypothetical protein
MFIPTKPVKNISSFFIDIENQQPIHQVKRNVYSAELCKPDMKWIMNKCMMKSDKYREMLEEDYKGAKLIVDPLIIKDPDLNKKYKKRAAINDTTSNYVDLTVSNNAFNHCALLYNKQCRKFYETRSAMEKFTLEDNVEKF